jgi:phage shock protein A
MRKLTEEQAENINSLQNELQSSRKNLKIVEQKRENGRLEISRLREKIDDLKQKSMNQSLNSSFNLDMVHVTDTSVHLEPNQVQDMLEK